MTRQRHRESYADSRIAPERQTRDDEVISNCRYAPRTLFDQPVALLETIDGYRDVAPVTLYQLVQTSIDNIEVQLVVERALSADEEASLSRVIHESLGYPFELSFRYYDTEIPRGSGHKFEEFVSLICC